MEREAGQPRAAADPAASASSRKARARSPPEGHGEQPSRDEAVEHDRGREDEPTRQPVGHVAGRESKQRQREELGEADQAESRGLSLMA